MSNGVNDTAQGIPGKVIIISHKKFLDEQAVYIGKAISNNAI